MTKAFLDYSAANRDWLLDFIEAIVAIESPSDDRAAVNRCGDELARRLESIGGSITRISSTDLPAGASASTGLPAGASASTDLPAVALASTGLSAVALASTGLPAVALASTGLPAVALAKAGDHLRATFGSGSKQILLLGHFDTVWPVGQLARMPLKRDAGRLHGPGVFDMKAGIGLAALATRALMERAAPSGARIVMLWTTDEEIGSGTSRMLIEAEAAKSDAVLVFEPSLPGGALKTSRKGVGQFEMIARGVAAHAGLDPGKGVSAIRELAHQILTIDRLQNPANGVTLTVGVVSGGTRSNVVPAEARATIDARAVTRADADRVQREMLGLKPQVAGAQLEVTGGFDRPPLERSPGVAKLFELARETALEIGVTLEEGSAGGGSDGNFTAALGIPTLDGLGAIGDGAHALHEHVEIDALVTRAATIAGLLAALTRGDSSTSSC